MALQDDGSDLKDFFSSSSGMRAGESSFGTEKYSQERVNYEDMTEFRSDSVCRKVELHCSKKHKEADQGVPRNSGDREAEMRARSRDVDRSSNRAIGSAALDTLTRCGCLWHRNRQSH